MTTDLQEALRAMGTLNAWVRTTGATRPRKAVYWLKSNYAVRDAAMRGMLAFVRVVQATVKCNRCRNGMYIDWDGNDRGACYHCNGKGRAALKFVETTIDGVGIWHSPLHYSSWLGWPVSDITPEEITDWEPGREGIELDANEAARLLNIVETYWPQWLKEKPYSNGFEEYDSNRYFHFNYSLVLPPFGSDVCMFCDGMPTTRLGHTRPPGLETTWPACAACAQLPYIWENIKSAPLPELPEHVKVWRDRHAIAFAELWKNRWLDEKEWQVNRIRHDAAPKTGGLFRLPHDSAKGVTAGETAN